MSRHAATTTHTLDTAALLNAIECERMARGLTKVAVADAVGCGVMTFTRLAAGSHLDPNILVSLLAWLGSGVVLRSPGDIANYTKERAA